MSAELIARLESADGPSRELDAAIAAVTKLPSIRYTGSTDAALTLVPDVYRVGVLMEMEDGTWAAKLFNRGKPGGLPSRGGYTPALALAAAALKARGV